MVITGSDHILLLEKIRLPGINFKVAFKKKPSKKSLYEFSQSWKKFQERMEKNYKKLEERAIKQKKKVKLYPFVAEMSKMKPIKQRRKA